MNEARIQISKKAADGDLLNIRGDAVEELAAVIPALKELPDLAKFFAVENAVAGLGATVVPVTPPVTSALGGNAEAAPVQQPVQVAPAPQAVPQGQPDPAQYGQPCNKALSNGTICQGTKTKLVPAGVAKTSGKPYPAFWACPNDHR